MAGGERIRNSIAGGRRLCLDTNALIYLLEGVQPYHPWLERLFRTVEDGEREIVFSVVTEAEVMIRPLRQGLREALERIEATFAHKNVEVIAANREVAREAAVVRAELNLPLPDAFVVATAVYARCDMMVGNDVRCAKRVREIPYIYLEEAVRG